MAVGFCVTKSYHPLLGSILLEKEPALPATVAGPSFRDFGTSRNSPHASPILT